MKVLIFVLVSILFSSSQVMADVSNAYRDSNAVVLYDFAETSGNILDKADPKFGAPLNLEIFDANAATRSVGVLSIDSTNEIRSTGPADKITNTCKASGSMSFEIYLQNNESVEKRAGLDSSERPQPLRIISLSKGLFDRNFVFGQFYDMGNLYATGVSTSKNEMGANNKGNSLKDPLFSKVSATLVPNPNFVTQKIIFTINPSGVARLYLSDRNGNMYLAETNTTGFGSDAASQFFRLGPLGRICL